MFDSRRTVRFGSNSSRGVLLTIGPKKVEFSFVQPNNTLKNLMASRVFPWQS